MPAFSLIAYPDGARAVVATVYGSRESAEGSAAIHARLRGEYVDVEQDGQCVAVCDGAGPAHGYGEFRVS